LCRSLTGSPPASTGRTVALVDGRSKGVLADPSRNLTGAVERDQLSREGASLDAPSFLLEAMASDAAFTLAGMVTFAATSSTP
jgi:hypothetical protein